jgi:hypothetical protein
MSKLNAMKIFLSMGDITNEGSREDKLKYQERIVFATMKSSIPGWQPPSDWYELSLDEREDRIDKLRMI